MSQIPHDLQEALDSRLEPQERVLWVGQPNARRMAMKSVLAVIPGLGTIAGSVYWMGTICNWHLSSDRPGQTILALVGLLPLFGGLALASLPLWSKRRARRILYAVTNRRAFAIEGMRNLAIRVFSPEDIGQMRVRQRRDGSGDIILAREVVRSYRSQTVEEFGFLSVDDVVNVETLLRGVAKTVTASQNACLTRLQTARRSRFASLGLGGSFTLAGITLLCIMGQSSTLVCRRASSHTVNGVLHRTLLGMMDLPDHNIEGIRAPKS